MAKQSLAVVDQSDDEEVSDDPTGEVVLERSRAIVGRLDQLAQEQVRKKQPIEERWIKALRQYWGKYDDGTNTNLTEQQKSRAFVKLTRHKTNGWAARLSDLLFPTDEKNWGVAPTPVPDLVKAAKMAAAAAAQSVDGANQAEAQNNPRARDMMLEQAKSYAQAHTLTQGELDAAKEACDKMEKAIEDQLVECRYIIQCRDVIEDGCRLGTGILKGPVTSQKLKREWVNNPIGHWTLKTLPDPMPEGRRVDPWHFFPDMSARTIEEAEFSFERHLPTKKDLRRLSKKMGFSEDATRRLLREGPLQTNPQNIDHLAILKQMIGEGTEPLTNRYLMWEYHGPLECSDIAILLRAMGKAAQADKLEEEADELEEYRVIAYFCNNELLKLSPDYPLDSGETLYSVWNFEKGETSIFGIGVPELIADSQSALNGAWRMMLDNAALSVGPQVVIDRSQVQPAIAGDWKIRANKVWLRTTTTLAGQNKPFETFDIPCNQSELAGIVQLAQEFMDQESSMPTIAEGEQGTSGQTLGGMSMLFNSANVVFRRVVKSWDDDITTPTIRRFYDWNMQFNSDQSIKGDMQVDARGTSVLLVREIQSQNLLQVVTNWSVHQVLGPWVKVRPAIVKALQTMMVPPDDVIKTQDEYDADMKKAAEAAAKNPPPDPNQIKLQIATSTNESREKIAEATNQSRESIAEMNLKALMLKLEGETGLTQQELEAKYGLEHAKINSQERMKAVDIAVEDRRAAQAKAAGDDPEAAVGKGIG
jgi:hypothetical protein